jgi:hypothetical protein
MTSTSTRTTFIKIFASSVPPVVEIFPTNP